MASPGTMSKTRAVDVSIYAVVPVSMTGASAAHARLDMWNTTRPHTVLRMIRGIDFFRCVGHQHKRAGHQRPCATSWMMLSAEAVLTHGDVKFGGLLERVYWHSTSEAVVPRLFMETMR